MSETTRRNETRSTHRTLPAAGLALTLLLLAACGGDGHQAAPGEGPPALAARTAVTERTQVTDELEITGTVEADRTSAVSTRVMAMVTDIHVKIGDPIRRGQLLLEIDPQAARGQVSQAQGALAQARAALALAERNYERFKALAETSAASELELDQARMHYEQARGAVEQAEGALSSASSVASDSRVIAPFDGRVVRRMVEVGDLAAPGRPLLMLESAATRRLSLAVPESLVVAGDLGVGDELPVRIDARPDLGTLTGTVVEMSPGADPLSHSYTVKAALGAPDLATGAAGRAILALERREAVLVPESAVLRRGGMTLVVVADAEGRVSSRVVTLGGHFPDDRVEVLSGLAGGEPVLLGLEAIPPAGARIEATGDPETAPRTERPPVEGAGREEDA